MASLHTFEPVPIDFSLDVSHLGKNSGINLEENKILANSSAEITSTCRRSSRKIRKPILFRITHERRPDPELAAAIKRSRLDTHQSDIDYASIRSVPTVQATPEEFRNPILLWDNYSHLGEEFGAIKVIPPEPWNISVPFDSDSFQFKVRKQELKQLLTGNGFSHPLQLWNCRKLSEYNDKLLIKTMNTTTPSLESVEAEYWRLLKSGSADVTTYYGADLNIYTNTGHSIFNITIPDDPWHPHNLPKCDGSLLKYMKHIVPGVNRPWLYIGMCFTTFCWHTEDNYFGSCNYHHSGAPKVWYVVPPRKAIKMETLLKNYIAMESEHFALYSLRVQIPPDVLIANDIPVYRIVQCENEFVLVWPRTFHAGFNTGYNCNEACNVAPGSWIKMGYQSLLNYKFARKTCIPFYRIIFSSLPNIMDLDATHISQIMDCISLLLIQEFELRNSVAYPRYQMFIDLDAIRGLDELQKFLSSSPKDDFEPCNFVDSLISLESDNNDLFLNACKDLASCCIKDCDLCDIPAFGSCLLCNHINTVICLTCLDYHECPCKTRVVLYGFTLRSLYNILSILKSVYQKKTGNEWLDHKKYAVPSLDAIIKLDSESFFSCFKLIEASKNIGMGPSKSITKPSRSSKYLMGLGTEDLERINSYDDINESCKRIMELPPSHGRGNKKNKRQKKDADDESQIGDISIKYPPAITKVFSRNPTAKFNVSFVTKLSLKYMILAIEEDKKENV